MNAAADFRDAAKVSSFAALVDPCRVLGALYRWAPSHPALAVTLDLMRRGALLSAWPCGTPAALAALSVQFQTAVTSGVNDLVAEHQRLFVGPESLSAPPWGSVYREQDGGLHGDSTLALSLHLEREGVSTDALPGEPVDHVGLVLQAVAGLAELGRERACAELVAVHLLSWVPSYLDRLEAATGHPYYQALIALTRLTLEGLADALRDPAWRAGRHSG